MAETPKPWLVDESNVWFVLWGLAPVNSDMETLMQAEMQNPIVESVESYGNRNVLIMAHNESSGVEHDFHELFALQKQKGIEPVTLDNHDFAEFEARLLFNFNGHLSPFHLVEHNDDNNSYNGIHSLRFNYNMESQSYINLSKVGVLTIANVHENVREYVLDGLREIVEHNEMLMGE